MSDGRLVLISTNMFKPASEEGGRPFMLSAAPLTASSISKEGGKNSEQMISVTVKSHCCS